MTNRITLLDDEREYCYLLLSLAAFEEDSCTSQLLIKMEIEKGPGV